MGDIYVFDAFGTSHREQASTHSAILNSRNACAGLLLEKEIDALTKALNNSDSPYTAVIGGSKVSTKLELIKNINLKADYIKTVVGCLGYDGVIAVGGCDKNMPGCIIGMARLNRPSIFIYGGSIKPSKENTDYVTVCEKTGEYSKGDLKESELIHVEKISVKGPGSCGGMYTANTMASAIEALGMSLPGSSSQDAISHDKEDDCFKAGEAIMNLLEKDIKPSDIMTKNAFENAITMVIALGGSTNAVLHLLAMAHSIGVDLELDDFTRIGKKTPVMADLKPFGSHYMSELNANGGIQPLMKTLLEKGLLHGECLTVTGQTLAENLSEIKPYEPDQEIIKSFDDPIKSNSHLRILYGNLAKDGAVAKITGKEGTSFEGSARVFDSEEEGVEAILSKSIKAGDVVGSNIVS